ncbi:MAG: aminodeoxychorismate lyase [Gammaproteobacteria bacterium HGW-Gammaproteobacteria-6]|nr:MAG: aminodeoxychorismate lyase [Gammaproteobacteria bacterium HGW-Gammaproteobacteria-6]
MTSSGTGAHCHPDCLIDGQAADQVSVRDRGLNYGDGLFETLRVAEGAIALLDYHLARLSRGLKALRLDVDLQLVATELRSVAADLGCGVLKLVITRGAGQRGYAMPAQSRAVRILQLLPPSIYDPVHAEQGVQLFDCQTRLGLQPALAGIKHLNRLEQVLARSEWTDSRYAEGLVLDMQGRPVEGTMSNLFVCHAGRWLTPALHRCGVRGVMRDYLIDHMPSVGLAVEEADFDEAMVSSASEVFCCNSLFGVWPVIAWRQQVWPVGPQTRLIQSLARTVIK